MLLRLLTTIIIAVSGIDAGWPGNSQCYPAPQIYPAQAPGVLNPLGKGQEYVSPFDQRGDQYGTPGVAVSNNEADGSSSPAPVRWYNASLGQNVYLFPDINFGSLVYLRVSPDLSEVQYNPDNRTPFSMLCQSKSLISQPKTDAAV